MADNTYKSNSTNFEELYIKFSEVGMPYPNASPKILNSWGWNTVNGTNYGTLGQSNNTNYSSPVQVGLLTDWSKVSSGRLYCLAIKADGSLWAWGYNASGELGLGDRTTRSSPVQVGTLINWTSVSSGNASSLAVKTDGTLWSWGYNGAGQLGQGNTTSYSSPVQVGALTDWSSVSNSHSHTLAVKTDGTLWSWGEGTNGKLGQGNTVSKSSPVQVGALTDWSKVYSCTGLSIAIKTDGTLWSWGNNGAGQLGQGNITSRSSPVQVGNLTNWDSVTVSSDFNTATGTTLAIKTDGTLWSWGYNGTGQLGQGNTTSRSSPVQVGALTTWSKVSTGDIDTTTGTTLAIKTDGTLWSWGDGFYGKLGQGNTTSYSSPVQVGTLTTWNACSVGDNQSIALKNYYT